MDENQWMYDSIMFEEVDMDDKNEQECDMNEQHVDCSDAFNTSQVIMFIIVFGTRDDDLRWARSIAHENGQIRGIKEVPTCLFKRLLSFTASSIVMVWGLSSLGKAVANSIY
ncbi:hypothetical protein GmHk_06G016653 [Glycine max]|nr:hypothetical protein GmHk_06G016653 [Glycine max]